MVVQHKMTAREKREMIGGIMMAIGMILIVAGLIVTYVEYQSLPIEKLALMAIVEGVGLGVGMTSAGFIFFFAGLGVYLANNNNQAWRRASPFRSRR